MSTEILNVIFFNDHTTIFKVRRILFHDKSIKFELDEKSFSVLASSKDLSRAIYFKKKNAASLV